MRLRLSVLFCFTAVCVSACASGVGNNNSVAGSPAPAAATANVTSVSSNLFGSQPLGMSATSAALVTATPLPSSTSVTTYTVQRGRVIQEQTLSGQVIEARQRELTFGMDGQVKNLAITDPGPIKKGQLLAQLDLGDLPDQLTQAQSAYAQGQAAIARATAALQAPVQRAQLDLETAQTKLAQLQGSPDQNAVAKAQSAVAQAQAALAKTRNDASAVKTQAEQQLTLANQELNLAKVRYDLAVQNAQSKKGSAADAKQAQADVLNAQENLQKAQVDLANAQIAYDTARGNEVAEVQNAEAQLASAQADYNTLLSGPSQAALSDARQAVKLATINLAAARASAQPDPTQLQALTTAQNDIKRLQTQIDARQLVAPFDGEIVKIMAQPGLQVQASTPVFVALDASIPASDQLIQVNGVASQDTTGTGTTTTDTTGPNVVGASATQLQIGQKVTVSFDRYSGKTFPGTVSGSVSNGFQIKYDTPNLDINTGDQAEVIVELARKDNVLWLPSKAIGSETPSIVTVQKGSDRHQVTIKTGVTGQDRVEILSGLSEGDIVVGQ